VIRSRSRTRRGRRRAPRIAAAQPRSLERRWAERGGRRESIRASPWFWQARFGCRPASGLQRTWAPPKRAALPGRSRMSRSAGRFNLVVEGFPRAHPRPPSLPPEAAGAADPAPAALGFPGRIMRRRRARSAPPPGLARLSDRVGMRGPGLEEVDPFAISWNQVSSGAKRTPQQSMFLTVGAGGPRERGDAR